MLVSLGSCKPAKSGGGWLDSMAPNISRSPRRRNSPSLCKRILPGALLPKYLGKEACNHLGVASLPPSNSGTWRVLLGGIYCQHSNPGGDCYWVGDELKVITWSLPGSSCSDPNLRGFIRGLFFATSFWSDPVGSLGRSWYTPLVVFVFFLGGRG